MTRGITPVIAAPLLIGMTIGLAALIGIFTLSIGVPIAPAQPTSIEVTSNAETNHIIILNTGTRDIDVRQLTIHIQINDQPLIHQLSVPYFSQRGFHPGPTGAFNTATEPYWRPGHRVSFRIANTNHPTLSTGDTLTIELTIDDLPIATSETRVP